MDEWVQEYLGDAILDYEEGAWGGFRLTGAASESTC